MVYLSLAETVVCSVILTVFIRIDTRVEYIYLSSIGNLFNSEQ